MVSAASLAIKVVEITKAITVMFLLDLMIVQTALPGLSITRNYHRAYICGIEAKPDLSRPPCTSATEGSQFA